MRLRAVALAGASLMMGACESTPALYAWGSYEDMIYVAQARPGELTPQAQAMQLEQEALEAQAAGRRLPPGWHAHLASLYDQMGNPGKARELLLLEKALFPESAVFVDSLVRNLDGRSVDTNAERTGTRSKEGARP